MSDMSCTYSGDREQTLIAYLYDEIAPVEREAFDAHLDTCARCRRDLAAFGGLRQRLGRWQPPLPRLSTFTAQLSPSGSQPPWYRQVPAWAQVAAALLFLGVSAGVANLDVRYDANGLNVRTGWSKVASPSNPANQFTPANVVNRSDLTALEERLRTEMHAAPVATAQDVRPAAAPDAETLRRVRALIDESERREQRELALRVAQVLRDVNLQRQADLSKIDRNLGLIQNTTGVEILKQREMVNYLMRVSQRQ